MSRCEACGVSKEMNFNMPTALGIFTADMCMKCGFAIENNESMLMKVIEKRAKRRGIKLPVNFCDMKNLLNKKRR